MHMRQVGNRYHFREDPAAPTPLLHVHAVTGGFLSPTSTAITSGMARAAVAMLTADGADATAAAALAWWGNNHPTDITFRRKP